MKQTDKTPARLVIICGLPGSGKTTLAKKLEVRLHAIRFCPDEWLDALSLDLYDQPARTKIETLQWKLAEELLARGTSVIIEWGTWQRSERDALRQQARSLGIPVELHYLSANEEMLYERVKKRNRESPPIGRGEISKWVLQFEAPTSDEMALYDTPTIAAD